MDSCLLYRDSSAEGKRGYYAQYDIIKDINLDILFRTMARADTFITEKSRKIMMIPLETPEEILYRQRIVEDFYAQTDLLDSLYECAVCQHKALRIYKEEAEKFGGGLKIDHAIVNYCESIKQPKKKAKQGGLQKFYYNFVKRNAIPINSNEALLQDVNHLKEFTMQQILKIFSGYLNQMMKFFEHFSEEIAFYRGIVNFMARMHELTIPLSMPVPQPIGTKDTKFKDLYELSMAIYLQSKPVGNTLELNDTVLTLITGANQGGKSTFLRSYGIAQILMQCGMPVPAKEFRAPIYRQVFTHFTRREDEQLNSGRLREELQRMSNMVKAAGPNCIFLLNESFASTTEKEGSKIAEGILRAFYEKDITTIMVTHLFQLAKTLYAKELKGTAFLVAERKPGGARTYRMLPGEPGYTSYGTDLFEILESEL